MFHKLETKARSKIQHAKSLIKNTFTGSTYCWNSQCISIRLFPLFLLLKINFARQNSQFTFAVQWKARKSLNPLQTLCPKTVKAGVPSRRALTRSRVRVSLFTLSWMQWEKLWVLDLFAPGSWATLGQKLWSLLQYEGKDILFSLTVGNFDQSFRFETRAI